MRLMYRHALNLYSSVVMFSGILSLLQGLSYWQTRYHYETQYKSSHTFYEEMKRWRLERNLYLSAFTFVVYASLYAYHRAVKQTQQLQKQIDEAKE
jgi:hypothetical protein